MARSLNYAGHWQCTASGKCVLRLRVCWTRHPATISVDDYESLVIISMYVYRGTSIFNVLFS